jgi:hypothetical protein
MHAGGHQFSKSILQRGNVELQSKTDGTDPEGIVEGAKIKLKGSPQILARKF